MNSSTLDMRNSHLLVRYRLVDLRYEYPDPVFSHSLALITDLVLELPVKRL